MPDSDGKNEIYLSDSDDKKQNKMMEDQIKQMMNAMESMQARLVMAEAALGEARVASTMTQKTTHPEHTQGT